MIHWWEPLGRMTYPEPITPEQSVACARLRAAARQNGGIIEVHNSLQREERADPEAQE